MSWNAVPAVCVLGYFIVLLLSAIKQSWSEVHERNVLVSTMMLRLHMEIHGAPEPDEISNAPDALQADLKAAVESGQALYEEVAVMRAACKASKAVCFRTVVHRLVTGRYGQTVELMRELAADIERAGNRAKEMHASKAA